MDAAINAPDRYRPNTSAFRHYWTAGAGKELLARLGYVPDLKQADPYIPYLFRTDEAADQVVARLHMQTGFCEGQQLVEAYLNGPGAVSGAPKAVLDAFFENIEVSPSWLDRTLMQKGVELSQRSAISGLIVLRDYCLMGGYESSAINKPLIYTGALKKGAVKRISETVEFWVDITGDNALEPGHIGFKSIIKTRMIHSYSRVNILRATDWDNSRWGAPLNFWDMLATHLGFSIVYLTGLKRMGIEPSDEETQGLLHFWKYIGYLLGIPVTLLPGNEKEAIEALYYWTMTQADGDQDSKALAHALQEEPVNAYYPRTRAGRALMREIHLFYNEFLLGPYSCSLLCLDKTVWGKIAYLNVLKNKFENRMIGRRNGYREKLIRKGRRQHEEIKRIYLEYRLEKPGKTR